MGHFSQTCAISHLPIVGGDPISVVFLVKGSPHGNDTRFGGPWGVIGVPFRGVYNDYGKVEQVDPRDSVCVDLNVDLLNAHLVERPWGENLCHDVPVRHGMDFDALTEALWEGRLALRDTYYNNHKPGPKVPKGVPTWRRVERVVKGAEGRKELIDGTVVDRIDYGVVRVRFKPYDDKALWCEQVRKALETKYTVIERYEHGVERHQELKPGLESWDVWFEIRSKGETPPNPRIEQRQKHMATVLERYGGKDPSYGGKVHPVRWAFVKEDVWKATLSVAGTRAQWGSKVTGIRKALGGSRFLLNCIRDSIEEGEQIRRYGGKPEMPTLSVTEDLESYLRQMERRYPTRKTYPVRKEKRAIRSLAELSVVCQVVGLGCRPWVPTFGGPQDGCWQVHRKLALKLAPCIDNAGRFKG